MLGLILLFQIVIILLMMICFIVLKQQHKDLNINITTTRRIIRNMKTDMTIDELKEDINSYILVKFPESQTYMNLSAFHKIDIQPAVNVDGALFVRKDHYNKYKNK